MKIMLLSATCLMATLLIIQSCHQVDLDSRRRELTDCNERMRTAHLEGDHETILAGMAYPYTKVRNGEVTHPTREENAARYEDYMTSMSVTVWDDLQDPIITLSDDGSMATVVYKKRLAMEAVEAPEGTEPYEGVYAWQSTYRFIDDGWKMIADVTTSQPGED